MELEKFEEAVQKDDFALGESFWLGDWEFEVVNRRHGGRAIEDEVVFRWELTSEEFVQLIADNHAEIEDPAGFFDKHRQDILHRFRKGFDILVGECGATYGTVMNDAIDEAVGQEPEAPASCPEVRGREDEEGTETQGGKTTMIVSVAGERIVDIYESENGRCWYITERIQRQGQGFVSGYVRCLQTSMLAEFQHLPEEVLQDTGQHVWRVPEEAWWRCPYVDIEEDGAGPTIIRCDGEEEGSRHRIHVQRRAWRR
jgi:hypothetical protein